METILSCFLLFAFFFFANSTDLPKLKTIQSNFPDDYFCNKSMSKYVPGESSVVLQCGLQALKLVRIQAKKSGKPDEKELYKKLYNEFGSRVDSMTYLGNHMSTRTIFSKSIRPDSEENHNITPRKVHSQIYLNLALFH